MGSPFRRFVLRHARWFNWLVLLAWLAALPVGLPLAHLRGWSPWLLWVPLLLSLTAVGILSNWTAWQRDRLIREGPLPKYLKRKVRTTYPDLSHAEVDLVERGLRQFFIACHRSKGRFVAMPSRAVDAMWHEFILHTQAYRDWCLVALGRFLHHTPAEVLSANAAHNDGLRRAWYWTCREEAIDPRKPTRLPLLFALDGKLGIDNGFRYLPDCRSAAAAGTDGGVQCGTSFSDDSHSGSSGDFGGAGSSDGDAGDAGGDGGGDGGGCGGGGGD